MPRISALAMVFMVAATAGAAILNVPAQYQTLQDAVNAANRGDTVLAAPGVYRENLDFASKSITVASRLLLTGNPAYIDSTVVDGHQAGACALFENIDRDGAVLQGFTLENGLNREGGGVSAINAAASVLNCLIRHNTAYFHGGGVYAENSNLFLGQCVIRENETDNGGGGGVFLHGGQVGVNRCDVSFNDTDIIDGGGFFIEASNPVIANTTIAFNCVDERGGGIFFTDLSMVTLRNVILWGNSPQQAWVFRENRVTILYTVIEGGEGDIVVDNPEAYLRWQDGNIFENPCFVDFRAGNLNLAWPNFPENDAGKSPCIDAGDPGARLDPDGTRSDIGGYPYFQTPFIAAEPETLVFNTIRVNESDWQWIKLRNGGGGTVHFSGIAILPPGAPFIVNNPEPFDLRPGGEHDLWLRFFPRSAARFEGLLHLDTNLESRPVVEMPLIGATLGVDELDAMTPTLFGISRLYPNPFNSMLQLEVGLPVPSEVKLLLIDNAGRATLELYDGWLPAGVNRFSCSGEGLAAGAYWLRLEGEGRAALQKVILAK